MLRATILFSVILVLAYGQDKCPDLDKYIEIINSCSRDRSGEEGGPVNGVAPCLIRCMMKKLNLFDDDGNFKTAESDVLLEECKKKYENLSSLFERTKVCLDEHGSTFKANEPTCTTFQQFADCAFPVVDEKEETE